MANPVSEGSTREGWGPLHGLRVLDIGQFIAGPVGGTLMAEFGAEVIKVELPGNGDGTRARHPLKDGYSVAWAMRARNKKAITLDLHSPRGQELFKQLVRKSDIVLENFRSGTLERWGLGYDVLKQENPGLILVRVSGFGQDGPYSNRSAFDRIGLAFAGLSNVGGSPERPPLRPGVLVSDYSSALFGVLGALAAIHRRRRDGQGGIVDLSIYEPVLRMMGDTPALYDRLGVARQRQGATWPTSAFFCSAEAADGRSVAVSVAVESDVAPAQARLGLSGSEFGAALKDWIAARPSRDAVHELREAGVACSVINTIADIMEDPHVRARGNVVTLDDQNLGPVKVQGAIPHLSRTPGRVVSGGPDLGEHNREIYGGLLGLGDAELEQLAAENTI